MSMPARVVLLAALALAVALVFALKRDDTSRAIGSPTASASRPAAGTEAPATFAEPSPGQVPARPAGAAAGSVSASATATTGLPRLVDVGADQCIPCKAMAPILESLRREYAGRLRVDFIDAWKHPEQVVPFRVYGIPTQIFLDPAGRELYRHIGFFSKEDILATWRLLGYPLTPQDESRP